ncbi:MAG: HypC/HybG/HupF family hydrogenase formation chaperone [Desulfurococcaceae archaeon]
MCLGVPAVVLSIDLVKMTAVVDYGDGIPRDVLIGISSERVEVGDIVIVHAGVIVSKISEQEILEQLMFFEEVLGDEATELMLQYKKLLGKSRKLIRGGSSGDS